MAAEGRGGQGEARRLKVLFVEDNPVDQLAFKRFVRDEGLAYDYEVADSAAAGKAALENGEYDILVTDYSLGDGTGFDVAHAARNMPVIFVTGAGDERVAARALRSGAADYLVKDHERNYLRVLPVTVDNALRRWRAEEQVRKLSRAVEQSPATVMITDTLGAIEYVNPKFSQLTGYAGAEVIGRNPRILKSGKQGRAFYTRMWETILGGEEWHGEFHNRRKDGTLFWENASISPLRDRDGRITHFVAVKEDITAEKELAEDREKLIAELDAFSHTVAHDLKSPLGAVNGFAELLLKSRQQMKPDEVEQIVRALHQSSLKMRSIIEELLLLAGVRKEDVMPEPLAMERIVDEAWHRLGYVAEARGARFKRAEKLPAALGYGPWIEEVWANYLSNAIKYGGEPPLVSVDAQREGDRVRFWVDDNGPGLDAEQQSRLFTPFTRLHQARATGQGLGLSIVRRIMEKLGGDAWVESQPGQGSRFGFTLPAA
jgi:PAS domain S-box-containing protein